jgi:hypothetical protein
LPKCCELTVDDGLLVEMCSCSQSDCEPEYYEEAGRVLSGCLMSFAYDVESRRPSYCVVCTLILFATTPIDREELCYLSKDVKATMIALNAVPKVLRPDQRVIDIKCAKCTQEYGNGEDITRPFDPFDELACNDFTCIDCESVLKHHIR